ncbi:hypothetical protein HPB50_008786 [Hyalomma asiaticum]|uniref:Uncharacterized protein n=1 Tax=Hyalomma asiaticum TaxID=266040 RepID=A0ACB7TEB0_HYAAI|nr:hypothetical protein HPB50_008786 [Hyalomma asiaticum]
MKRITSLQMGMCKEENGIPPLFIDQDVEYVAREVVERKECSDRQRNVLTTFWAATSNPRDLIFDMRRFWPVKVNEWLLIDNLGAYSMVLTCSFNGSGMPPVIYIAYADDADNVSKVIAAADVCSGYSQMERAIK